CRRRLQLLSAEGPVAAGEREVLLADGGVGRGAVLCCVDQDRVLHRSSLRRCRPYDERARPKSTARRRNVSAPALSSMSLRLPHFGLWTHEGQPSAHGQPASSRAVSAAQPSNCSKPRSAMPTPPAWPS